MKMLKLTKEKEESLKIKTHTDKKRNEEYHLYRLENLPTSSNNLNIYKFGQIRVSYLFGIK